MLSIKPVDPVSRPFFAGAVSGIDKIGRAHV